VSAPLLQDYRAGFLRWLGQREETALTAGYELGRAALASGRSVLEVVQAHHEVLAEVLLETPAAEIPDLNGAASQFLMEVLAPYAMAQRPVPRRPRGTPRGERGH
jgi:hypothetical protein